MSPEPGYRNISGHFCAGNILQTKSMRQQICCSIRFRRTDKEHSGRCHLYRHVFEELELLQQAPPTSRLSQYFRASSPVGPTNKVCTVQASSRSAVCNHSSRFVPEPIACFRETMA